MPRCCAASGGDRWRGCGRKSSRSRRRCSAASSRTWHGIGRTRGGLDALLDTIEQLQGVPLVASLLEHEILPARVADYSPAQLDTLLGAGEVSWVGVEPLGDRDGRIALYLTDHLPRLLAAGQRAGTELSGTSSAERADTDCAQRGASFFAPLHASLGGGFPQETVDALWSLVWKGLVTNDTLHALRAYLRPPERARRPGRSRRRSDRDAWCRRRRKDDGAPIAAAARTDR